MKKKLMLPLLCMVILMPGCGKQEDNGIVSIELITEETKNTQEPEDSFHELEEPDIAVDSVNEEYA